MTLKSIQRAALLLACGVFVTALPALAQSPDGPPPPPAGQQGGPGGGRGMMNPDRRAQMMQNRLGLSADQTAQVKAILVDDQGKMEALRSNTSAAPADLRSQMMALRSDEETKIRAILTPDQKAKYDDMLAQQRNRGGGPGGPGGPPPPPQTPPPPPVL